MSGSRENVTRQSVRQNRKPKKKIKKKERKKKRERGEEHVSTASLSSVISEQAIKVIFSSKLRYIVHVTMEYFCILIYLHDVSLA